jgi:hypothetical protein
VEHDALIATVLKEISNAAEKRRNSRMSPGVMSVDQATLKKELQACRKSDPRTE